VTVQSFLALPDKRFSHSILKEFASLDFFILFNFITAERNVAGLFAFPMGVTQLVLVVGL
jgi:hypothetical protein